MANKDYYSILGVEKNATDDVLKKAYRKLSLKYHPDRQGGKSEQEKKEAEDKFKEVVEAYDILSDKEKRQQYDMFGTVDGGFGSNGPNMDDIISRFMRHTGGFSSFFDEDFGGSKYGRGIVKGNDKKVRVTLTLEEVYKRGKKTIKYDRYKPCSECGGKGSKNGNVGTCPYCHGSGFITQRQQFAYGFSQTSSPCPHCHGSGKLISNPCNKCGGSGLVLSEESFTFDIPLGITDNVAMSVPRMGHYCERLEGQEGDLTIIFRVAEDDRFKIIPNSPYDLAYIDETPVLDCIIGCEKTIKHIDGKTYKYTLRQGIEDGSIISLGGKGLAKGNGLYGDLKIVVKYKMPSVISNDDRKLIDKLKKSHNFS